MALKLHRQFGHPNSTKLVKLIKSAGIRDTDLERELEKLSKSCETCLKFKRPVPRPIVALPLASKFNQVVAMDLKSFGDGYFLVLVDHATRYCASAYICNKKPATVVQALFMIWISLFGPPSKFLSDNGGEFQNCEMRQLGETFNIKLMTTAAESPWSNGICEKLNGVLAQSVRKVMDESSCDVRTALAWAVSARNTLDNYSGFSPCQLVFGYNTVLPNVLKNDPPGLEDVNASKIVRNNLNAMYSARHEFIKVESSEKLRRALRHNIRESNAETFQMGDSVFYKRNDDNQWRGPGVVIGRDGKQVIVKHGGLFVRVHGCRLASGEAIQREPLPESEDKTIANDVSAPEVSPKDEEHQLEYSDNEDSVDSEDNSEPGDYSTPDQSIACDSSGDDIEATSYSPMAVKDVRVGKRIQGIDNKTGEIITAKVVSRAGKSSSNKTKHCYNLKKSDDTVGWYDLSKDINDLREVPDYEELLVFFNGEEVSIAKERELENWQANNVYEEVENRGQPTISVRWVITEKIKEGESIVKARLVARGFEEDSSDLQKDSPTCLKESVKITLSIASAKSWEIRSLDIRSAYLQGKEMEREVFLKPPPEFDNGCLWRLQKCVYGLSDAARSWYVRVREQLLELGLRVCAYDNAVFSFIVDGKLNGVICLYVDDFLFCGTGKFMDNVISKISEYFIVGNQEIDTFKYIGLNITSGSQVGKNTVDQMKYCASVSPMSLSRARANNKHSDLSVAEKKEFRSIIGQLNWVATQTRPDIAFDVCELSGCVKNATVADVLRLNKVVARLKNDGLKITIPKFQRLESWYLECFCDSSYANLPGGGSQGGLIVFIRDSSGNRCPVYWQSRKLRRVVKSTLAAETMALLECAETAFFIAKIISDLVCIPPPKVFCYVDNLSIVNSLKSSKLVDDKRLRIDIAALQDMISSGELHGVEWVSTNAQLADPLTKKGASTERLREAISC